MLQSEPYSKLLKKLPITFMCNYIWQHQNYDVDITVIAHACGKNAEERKICLNAIKNNKYWAPYFNDLIPKQTEENE
jgi:hypothetical protein